MILDSHGQREQGIAEYRVLRYEQPDDMNAATLVGVLPSTVRQVIDTDPALRPPFGTKNFWYRVVAVDLATHESLPAVAASGHLRDITPPRPPVGIAAEGLEDRIRLTWAPSPEPDLDGYAIYRSLCHFGQWMPCQASRQASDNEANGSLAQAGPAPPCSGSFVLIDTLSRDEAEARAGGPAPWSTDPTVLAGVPWFEDRSVPPNSPLCYAYLIKALDRAQNRSGTLPPDLSVEHYVCQRLRDRTAPEAAIITGLRARDRSVRVDWIGPPVQDIAAYHVYRSETEAGPWDHWVGGSTVERPPAQPKPLAAKYTPSTAGCDAVPVQSRDDMSRGWFVDRGVQPKRTYWYKVVGVDVAGNEALLAEAVPVSTFTFTTEHGDAPVLASVQPSAEPCGLRVSWTPAFDAKAHRGFVVFRASAEAGPFVQRAMVQDDSFVDTEVLHGRTYWYRVQILTAAGHLSSASLTAKGGLPQ